MAVDVGVGAVSVAFAAESVVEREDPLLLVLAMRGAEARGVAVLVLVLASTWAWKRLMSSDARPGRDSSIVGTVACVRLYQYARAYASPPRRGMSARTHSFEVKGDPSQERNCPAGL